MNRSTPACSRRAASRVFGILTGLLLVTLGACSKPDVVIYVSLDKTFSESFLQQFEKDSGLSVRAVYDTEAAKTVGLVNTLVAEKDHPRADVFWNNELANTIKLKNLGLLESYISPNAATIPDAFKDQEGYWTGFAARARVLIVNNDLVPEAETPTSMHDLLDPKWKGKCGIAKPLAGTTFTHFAALPLVMGETEFDAFIAGIHDNEVQVATGNAHIMKLVSAGKLHWGFTDTDDFHVALTDDKPVRKVYPDQDDDGVGTMLIPNSVMLIKNSPNPDNGKILIDYILRKETEKILAESRSAQIPLHPGVETPDHVRVPGKDFRPMKVDFIAIGARLDEANERLTKEFNR